jgi:hypothetical protein
LIYSVVVLKKSCPNNEHGDVDPIVFKRGKIYILSRTNHILMAMAVSIQVRQDEHPERTSWARFKQACRSLIPFGARPPLAPDAQPKPQPKKEKQALSASFVDSEVVVPASQQADYKGRYWCYLTVHTSRHPELENLSEAYQHAAGSPCGALTCYLRRERFEPMCKVTLILQADPEALKDGVLVLETQGVPVILKGIRKERSDWIEYGFAFDVRRLFGDELVKCYIKRTEPGS